MRETLAWNVSLLLQKLQPWHFRCRTPTVEFLNARSIGPGSMVVDSLISDPPDWALQGHFGARNAGKFRRRDKADRKPGGNIELALAVRQGAEPNCRAGFIPHDS